MSPLDSLLFVLGDSPSFDVDSLSLTTAAVDEAVVLCGCPVKIEAILFVRNETNSRTSN